MQAAVMIPAFDRPEMVWLCLDHLALCREVIDMQIHVCIDGRDGHAPLDEFIAATSAHPDLPIELHVGPAHYYHGNSFNVLNAYRTAYDAGADLIYLVEDDVMVLPQFFAWHIAVQERPGAVGPFGVRVGTSVGVRNPGHGAYASLGVCHDRNTVEDILEHAVPRYFRDMRGYCARTFPPSPFDCEQDGLIARVIAGCTVAWADPPVCSHIGWYGYHRKRTPRPTGTLAERVQKVRDAFGECFPGGAADVELHTATNTGTYTLSTVPGRAA